jgi:hypothetical protein
LEKDSMKKDPSHNKRAFTLRLKRTFLQLAALALGWAWAAGALSCGKAGSLSPERKRMARVVAELELLRGRIPPADSSYSDSAAALLRLRGVEPGDFRKFLSAMDENPECWADFYREVRSQIVVSKSSEAAPR